VDLVQQHYFQHSTHQNQHIIEQVKPHFNVSDGDESFCSVFFFLKPSWIAEDGQDIRPHLSLINY
jgi:hypothetical protein